MAVVVDVLKLTQVQGVVAVRGTSATGSIALATTLKKSTETQSSPKANIRAIHWTLGASGAAVISRDSNVLYDLTDDNMGGMVVHASTLFRAIVLKKKSFAGAALAWFLFDFTTFSEDFPTKI